MIDTEQLKSQLVDLPLISGGRSLKTDQINVTSHRFMLEAFLHCLLRDSCLYVMTCSWPPRCFQCPFECTSKRPSTLPLLHYPVVLETMPLRHLL